MENAIEHKINNGNQSDELIKPIQIYGNNTERLIDFNFIARNMSY